MIGTVVSSQPGVRVMAGLFFLIAAIFLVAAAATQNIHLAVFSILPILLGITARRPPNPPVSFEITEEGLAFQLPEPIVVPYADFRGLTTPGRNDGDNFPIHIFHTDGVIRIPPGLNESSAELYDFLLDRLPPIGGPNADAVPARLRDFVTEQLGLFGPDKVFVFRARPFEAATGFRQQARYSFTVMFAGIAWIAAGIAIESLSKHGGAWIGCGFLLLLMGLLFALLFSRWNTSGRISNRHESCLVISPGGIALIQGPLRGKMRWDELRAIEYPAKPRWGLTSQGSVRRGSGC